MVSKSHKKSPHYEKSGALTRMCASPYTQNDTVNTLIYMQIKCFCTQMVESEKEIIQ